jgi:hypothetical protein
MVVIFMGIQAKYDIQYKLVDSACFLLFHAVFLPHALATGGALSGKLDSNLRAHAPLGFGG